MPLKRLAKLPLARVDQALSNALSIGDAEEDFKLLSLPMTLSVNELHALLDRHPGNMLFGRAVAQYAKDHGHEDRSLLALAGDHVSAEAEKSNINSLYDIVLRYVSDDRLATAERNPAIRAFERMEAEGSFDNL